MLDEEGRKHLRGRKGAAAEQEAKRIVSNLACSTSEPWKL
jgi:hypothetical protein